ncbi:MAG TPA: outer membrane beta-barrel protein, partial [Saprospiraceae bacterium]|nr:outer membrane beta-barrel protein [Saprospiraceae bacterium]
DKKTDEQQATNSTIPSNEKEMNVVLKDDYKNITFGKGTVGAGNLDRLEGKLSINKFTPLHQISFIGVGNNTGRNGLGWEDREDFFGAQAFNYEELKYGFNTNFRFITYYEEDDINLDNKISELFWNNNNQGFPRNGLTGLNYNYETDKVKAGTRYVFNHKGNDMESFRSVNRFLPGNITNFDTTASATSTRGNVHKIEGNFSVKLDSFNNIKVYFDYGNLGSDRNFSSNGSSFRNVTDLISTSNISNSRNNNGSLSRGTLIYNKTFRKKSRYFGINSIYAVSDFTENTLNNSQINFTNIPIEDINQSFANEANKTQLQANATFSEPLSKKVFLNVFHNFDKTNQEGDVLVKDKIENRESTNTFLTRSYTTNVTYNFTGSSLRYSHAGLNLTAGFGYQVTDLYGEFLGLSNNNGLVDTTFRNPLYFGNIYYEITRNSSVSTSFTRSINTPRISQLTPVINNANPLYIREGNPSLQPEVNNSVFGNIWVSKPLSGLRFSIWSNLSLLENAITQEEIVTESLITTTRPINYKNSRNFNINPSISFPIIKNKVRASFNFNINESQSYRLVNATENRTQTFGFGPNATLNITPSQKFTLYLNSRIMRANTQNVWTLSGNP